MTTLYWILEYGKVMIGYLLLMFVWPSVVFGRHLSEKRRSYRFGFCVIVQNVLINTVVLMLGLFHILNRWTVAFVFYGILLAVLLLRFNQQKAEQLRRIATGSYGVKSLLLRSVKNAVKRQIEYVKQIRRTHLAEYALLLVLAVFGVIYFSWGAFQNYSYGIRELSVHHTRINALVEGTVFAGGVYPEAMHCFVYCLYALFGIKVYNAMLFLGGIHVAVFLIAAYFLMREIFRWRYTALFVLALFLMMDARYVDAVEGMARLQWTLPREFGMYAQFLAPLYLLRWLKSRRTRDGKDGISALRLPGRKVFLNRKLFSNRKLLPEQNLFPEQNLLLFVMALAAATATHVYAGMMAVFLSVVFGLFSAVDERAAVNSGAEKNTEPQGEAVPPRKKRFSGKRLWRERVLPTLAAMAGGILIGALPMLAAGMLGTPLHDSFELPLRAAESGAYDEAAQEGAAAEDAASQNGQEEKTGVIRLIGEKLTALYQKGYVAVYGASRARLMFWMTEVVIGLCIILCVSPSGKLKKFMLRYLPVVISSVVFMIAFTASHMGLWQIEDALEVRGDVQLIHLMILAIPVDVLFTVLSVVCRDSLLQVISVSCTAGIYLLMLVSGSFHGFLYHQLPRYNAEVMVTSSIMKTFPRYSYTIIAPDDNMYQILQHGNHQGLLEFIQKEDWEDFMLSTEYVFVYVEKRPIQYEQFQFAHGPGWLGEEKYPKLYLNLASLPGNGLWKEKRDLNPDIQSVSQGPQIVASEISEEAAGRDLTEPWLQYVSCNDRAVVESRAYDWCRRFKELYPFEMKVYYEDDDFICYYFRQETYSPYNLSIGQ